MTRVLAIGGRDEISGPRLISELDDILSHHPDMVLIHGACRTGSNYYADEWANENDVPKLGLPAEWGSLGKSAGPEMNATMIAEGKPDIAVIFPSNKGAVDMMRKARAANIEVIEVTP